MSYNLSDPCLLTSRKDVGFPKEEAITSIKTLHSICPLSILLFWKTVGSKKGFRLLWPEVVSLHVLRASFLFSEKVVVGKELWKLGKLDAFQISFWTYSS